jgi:multiple sugar transport system substrate-binding protein
MKQTLFQVLATTALVASGLPAVAETTLNALFMSQAAYSEAEVREMTAAFEAANPGVTVALEFAPYEALRDKTIAAAGAGEDGYDVVLFDVIWPAEFASRGYLLDVTDRIPAELSDQIFAGAWTTVEYEGRRYGMPWILDTKYFYYNKDMLAKAGIAAPPSTWQELLVQARKIKDKGIVEYPLVWSWSQSEAMICDLTTLTAAFGGDLMKDGKPAFQEGGARQAIEFMVSTLKDGLTNPASLEYLEEDVRRAFSNGDAAFAMNWTYMNGLANNPAESKVAGQIGIAPALGSEGGAAVSAVNGSMGLGIPANSPHADEAWAYITYMTAAPLQEQYAKLSLPIWKASYNVPAVTQGQEDLVAAATESIAAMTPRPLMASYTEVSGILQAAVHGILLGQTEIDAGLSDAAARIERIR